MPAFPSHARFFCASMKHAMWANVGNNCLVLSPKIPSQTAIAAHLPHFESGSGTMGTRQLPFRRTSLVCARVAHCTSANRWRREGPRQTPKPNSVTRGRQVDRAALLFLEQRVAAGQAKASTQSHTGPQTCVIGAHLNYALHATASSSFGFEAAWDVRCSWLLLRECLGAPPFARIASWQPACNCKQARPALPLNTRGGICPNNTYSTADYMPHVVMKAHELVIAVFSYGSQGCRTYADGFSHRNGTQSFPRWTCGLTLFAVATKYAAAVYVLSHDAWSPNKSQQT